MKVILLKDIKNYGLKNDIIEVENGYAKNYLIPKKFAILATKDNIAHLKHVIGEEIAEKEEMFANFRKIALEIESIELSFKLEFHNGRAQGSISLSQICETLEKEYNIKIDKRKFVKHENIRDIGTHELKIKLEHNIETILRVNINEK
ncbi:50S ribosomal protein L9 [Spiroplasma endosymbiont of Aspidapion aeneum]|uniref:50S ribosomal protein L9 n=1 Tax=Spiroplasma endosymbiont of Aspidapion aeneum TaxID=3066276 RepID=UPI00313A9FB2